MEVTFGRNNICNDVQAPYELSLTTSTISGILSLITVPGNLLICISMYKDPHRNLRTSFNYLVLNLAVADLIAGLITEPLFLTYHILEANGKTMINQFLWIVHMSYFITCLASLKSIAALSLERYKSVTSTHRRRLPPRRVFQASVLIWLASFALSNVYFATSFYKFVFIFANVAILTTLGIIVFAYARIRHSLRVRVACDESDPDFEGKNKAKRQLYEKKATRAFLYILVVFVLCNLSSCVATYALTFCLDCNCEVIHWLRDFQFLFALLNCSANQFLYALRMPTFKRASKSIMGFSRNQSSLETENDDSRSGHQNGTST